MPTPRRKPPKRSNGHAPAIIPADRVAFTTSRGVTVRLLKYTPLDDATFEDSVRADWQAAGRPLPAKPTYTIVALGDVEEVHEHDPKTIKGNPEAEAAWAAWEKDETEFNQEVYSLRVRSYVIDFMEFDVRPEWLAKAKAKRLHVPEDEYEAKVFWAQVEVWDGMADFFQAITLSAELAGVTGPKLEAVREAFRSALGGGEGAKA